MTNRFLLKQFAGNSGNNGVFGSFQSGSKELSNDPAEIQKLNAWDNGWCDAVSSGSCLPRLEEMQGLQYVLCKAVKELYSEGIPQWAPGETYYRYSIVSFVTDGVPLLYFNKTGSYTETDPAADTANWQSLYASLDGKANVSLDNLDAAGRALFDVRAKTDLSNVSANIDYVVSSVVSAGTWYRTWKSGWKEQGGISAYIGRGESGTIYFPAPFTQGVKTISFGMVGTFTATGESTSTITSITSSYFVVQCGMIAGAQAGWYAAGI